MADSIITVAPTGAWPTKEQNPAIPLSPREIAEDVFQCWRAGAAIAHLHMRDDDGRGTMDKARFVETVGRIRERCDVVLNLTSSGDLNATDEARMAHLIELKPELASYDAGTMNRMHSTLFINHPAFLERLAEVMNENGVKPEIEIFDAGMFYNAIGATVENLVFPKSLPPPDAIWSAFGIGAAHLPMRFAPRALGGDVRLVIKDNVFYAKGRLAKCKAEFVTRAGRIVRKANKAVATPSSARTILGLPVRASLAA